MKVLQLSTYPIIEPRHGGQIRVTQIRKKLESLGCEVRTVSITGPGYSKYDPYNDLVVYFYHRQLKYPSFHCLDLNTAVSCVSDAKQFSFIKKHVEEFKPNIIFLEQPWLWPSIKKMLELKILKREQIHLVYSSQNIESHIKELILEKTDLPRLEIERIKDAIFSLETECASGVDTVLCVTQHDADFLTQHSSATHVLLTPNGVSRRQVSDKIDSNVLAWLQSNPYIMLAASSYFPNVLGFWDMFGPSLAQFSLEHKIVTVGSVGDALIEASYLRKDLFHEVNKIVLKNMGSVSEEMLATVIDHSLGVILPITFGGGSNLKTAEAIAACKPIVATSAACRGYDFVKELSQVYICDDPHDFARTAHDIVSGKIKWAEISSGEKELRQQVYWDRTLAPLERIIERKL